MTTNTAARIDKYEKLNHRIGRITLPIGFALTFLPPLILWLKFGVVPDVKSLLSGILSISAIMAPVSLVEVITFSAMIGSGAIYICYLTGNIVNLKIPSAVMAMEVCETEPATEEGEIVSTIAMAGSVISSELVILLGVILLAPLTDKLSHPAVQPAFQQILPALFGALGAYYLLKEWRVAVMPLVLAIALNLVTDLPTALTIPLCVASSVLAARFLYKKGWVKGESSC